MRVHLAFAVARRPPAAAEQDDQCTVGRLKRDAITKVNIGVGMVFGKANEAPGGVFLNIYNDSALHRRC